MSRPAVGSMRPQTRRMNVVLPAPSGPMSAVISPARAASVTPASARTAAWPFLPGKTFSRPSAAITSAIVLLLSLPRRAYGTADEFGTPSSHVCTVLSPPYNPQHKMRWSVLPLRFRLVSEKYSASAQIRSTSLNQRFLTAGSSPSPACRDAAHCPRRRHRRAPRRRAPSGARPSARSSA